MSVYEDFNDTEEDYDKQEPCGRCNRIHCTCDDDDGYSFELNSFLNPSTRGWVPDEMIEGARVAMRYQRATGKVLDESAARFAGAAIVALRYIPLDYSLWSYCCPVQRRYGDCKHPDDIPF